MIGHRHDRAPRALIAMTKPPFLNGSSSSVRLRVPSGKIRNELPSRIDCDARSIDAKRRFAVLAFDGDEAAGFDHPAKDRQSC